MPSKYEKPLSWREASPRRRWSGNLFVWVKEIVFMTERKNTLLKPNSSPNPIFYRPQCTGFYALLREHLQPRHEKETQKTNTLRNLIGHQPCSLCSHWLVRSDRFGQNQTVCGHIFPWSDWLIFVRPSPTHLIGCKGL